MAAPTRLLTTATIAFLLATPGWAQSPKTSCLVNADGTREAIEEPRQDSKGNWTAKRDGRRTRIAAGHVVAVVDAAGKETEIIPELQPGPVGAETAAALASLCDKKNKAWRSVLGQLSSSPSRAAFDQLSTLLGDRNKELRLRAICGLAGLCTKESALAAAQAVLSEKHAATRRDGASALYSVKEIVRRSDAEELIAKGIADKDAEVRLAFAMLSKVDDEAAAAVLRDTGLRHRDHHIRESTALELGMRGDGAGTKLLLTMLKRSRVPGVEGDPELIERVTTREHVQVCEALGRIGGEEALAALREAAGSDREAVREAATTALAGR